LILDLSDEETRALLNVLMDAIEDARYPLSPRTAAERDPDEVRGIALAQKLGRHAPRAAAEALRAAEQGTL
jgi:hypothetical protein